VCYHDHVDDDDDTAAAYFSGITTDATRYIEVKVPTGGTESLDNQRHDGTWASNCYRLNVTSSYHLRINIGHLDVIGVCGESTAYASPVLGTGNGERWRFSYCVGKGNTEGNGYFYRLDGINTGGVGAIYNSFIYDMTGNNSSAVYNNSSGSLWYVHNCTIQNVDRGIRRGASAGQESVINCLFDTIADATFYGNGFSDNDNYNDYNRTTENSSHAALGTNGQYNITLGLSAGDPHLSASDTDAIDDGYDIEDDPSSKTGVYINFSDDIDNYSRSSGTWDVGCDEYVAGVGGQPYYLRIPRVYPRPFGRSQYR
jgi:hypothetical protein